MISEIGGGLEIMDYIILKTEVSGRRRHITFYAIILSLARGEVGGLERLARRMRIFVCAQT